MSAGSVCVHAQMEIWWNPYSLSLCPDLKSNKANCLTVKFCVVVGERERDAKYSIAWNCRIIIKIIWSKIEFSRLIHSVFAFVIFPPLNALLPPRSFGMCVMFYCIFKHIRRKIKGTDNLNNHSSQLWNSSYDFHAFCWLSQMAVIRLNLIINAFN